MDIHDANGVFDFCGGMLFQLVLSEKLRAHLAQVAKAGDGDKQPAVFDAAANRMAKMPNYRKVSVPQLLENPPILYAGLHPTLIILTSHEESPFSVARKVNIPF